MGSEEARYQWESAGGSAPEHWKFLPFLELLETPKSLSVGVMYPGGHAPNGVPLIRVNDVKNGSVLAAPTYFVSPEVDEEHKRTRLNGSELIITLVGEPGDCVVADPSMTGWNVARALAVARLADPSLRRWIRHVLLSAPAKHLIDSRLNTTVQKTLNLKDVKELGIPLPPKEERDSISNIIASLDDKIELNRRMNATLEGIAQALFKSWFVDFDPAIDNAIKAGNPIPDELADRAEVRRQALADGTANREAARAFPAAFQETEELGWIPEGWQVTAVSEAINVNPSTKLKKGDIAPFADMKALPTSGYAIDRVIEKAYSGGAKFRNGDVLLARITPCLENGKTGIVDFLTDSDPIGFGSTEFIVLRGEGNLSTPFVACLARDSNFRKHCVQSMIGSSGRQRVHNSCFESYYLALPKDQDVVKNFNGLAVPAFEKADKQANENKTLAKLRDTLLPNLISGELRIQDAEELIKL